MDTTEKVKSRWTRSFFTALNTKGDSEQYMCEICHRDFANPSNLTLHRSTHVIERRYKCEPCQVSFHSQGHLQKHKRSSTHETRVEMTQAFGIPTSDNPRPYGCPGCNTAFRKHGHLAKHLRSKSHITKLEANGLVPVGTYAALEKSGQELKDKLITTNCEVSLQSLRKLAMQLFHQTDTSTATHSPDSVISPNSSVHSSMMNTTPPSSSSSGICPNADMSCLSEDTTSAQMMMMSPHPIRNDYTLQMSVGSTTSIQSPFSPPINMSDGRLPPPSTHHQHHLQHSKPTHVQSPPSHLRHFEVDLSSHNHRMSPVVSCGNYVSTAAPAPIPLQPPIGSHSPTTTQMIISPTPQTQAQTAILHSPAPSLDINQQMSNVAPTYTPAHPHSQHQHQLQRSPAHQYHQQTHLPQQQQQYSMYPVSSPGSSVTSLYSPMDTSITYQQDASFGPMSFKVAQHYSNGQIPDMNQPNSH